MHTANGGDQALTRLRSGEPYAVIVSDMEMSGMNGIEFLSEARSICCDTVRVMMTAHGNLETALAAVNDGHVFRFLVKPYRSSDLGVVLAQAVAQYRSIRTERELLESTLIGSIQMLIDILALASPHAFGRANRIRSYARQVAEQLRLEPLWEVELAGLLCQIGCITIPPSTLARALSGDRLSSEEAQAYCRIYEVSAVLIEHIPRLERTARIISRTAAIAVSDTKDEPTDETPFEATVAAVLRGALEFDSLISRGIGKSKVIAELTKRCEEFHPQVVAAIAGLDAIAVDRRMAVVKSSELNSTMVIREKLVARNGHLVVGKDQQVTKSMRELIRSYVGRGILDDAVSVYLPADEPQVRVAEIIPSFPLRTPH